MTGDIELAKNFRVATEMREAFFKQARIETEMILDKTTEEIQSEEKANPIAKLRRIINSKKFQMKYLAHLYNRKKKGGSKKKYYKRKVKNLVENFR
jgi:hypothetical protein